MIDAFGPRSFVDAMLRFEAALARAEAAVGLIPDNAAKIIVGQCAVDTYDIESIVKASGNAGSVAIPLIAALREKVRAVDEGAAKYVHVGSTSQDVIDTASAMITRRALGMIHADVITCVHALVDLGQAHIETPMLARTLMQPASITSFGLKCAGWAAPLARSLARQDELEHHALRVQLGGAAGTQGQLKGKGAEVARLMAEELDLLAPTYTWHTQRDDWVALGCEIGVMVGSLGKIARDISLLGQYELGEVSEPSEAGRGGSSAMPHKKNPVASMVAIAAAVRAPQRVAALLAAMPQENERSLGLWQAELAEWPELLMSAHGSAHALASALQGLQVNVIRMSDNIQKLRADLPQQAANEWFDPAMAAHAGNLAREQLKGLVELRLVQ